WDFPADVRFRDIALAARIDGDARSAPAAVHVENILAQNGRDRVADSAAGHVAPPQALAVGWIDPLRTTRRRDQELFGSADLGKGRGAVGPIRVRPIRLPAHGTAG